MGLCLTGALTACDLDVVPPADIAAENFWQTEKDAWYALNTCYSTLDGVDIWDELCTDNAHSHNEIIGYHGSEEGLETLLGYQLFSIGNRADSAALAYQVDYVLDGYVKKAGTNFVLSVGRLIGSQPELKGEQRLRKEDIYWEMPRCYQWDITVNLPEGYRISPEGLERLNVKVENDCGAFIVQATTEDGTLRIKAEKRINHKTEPVANWEKLLEITDAANSYEALSIVFQATINPPTSPTTGY